MKKQDLIWLMILCLLILTNIIIVNRKVLTPQANNDKKMEEYNQMAAQNNVTDENIKQKTKEQLEQEKKISLSNMNEGKRMQTYFSDYMKFIENKEYNEAYGLLYPEFKENYFPTISKFIEYVQNTYPQKFAVEYEQVQSQGYLYVLIVYIDDADEQRKTDEDKRLKQSFVIDENGLNDYKLSFSVE